MSENLIINWIILLLKSWAIFAYICTQECQKKKKSDERNGKDRVEKRKNKEGESSRARRTTEVRKRLKGREPWIRKEEEVRNNKKRNETF